MRTLHLDIDQLFVDVCYFFYHSSKQYRSLLICGVPSNLSLLSLEHENQLDDENLGVGSDTWVSLTELQEEYNLKPFFTAVRNFYVASIKKMLQKIPFSDSFLKDLGVLQPENTASYSVDTVLGLAKCLP